MKPIIPIAARSQQTNWYVSRANYQFRTVMLSSVMILFHTRGERPSSVFFQALRCLSIRFVPFCRFYSGFQVGNRWKCGGNESGCTPVKRGAHVNATLPCAFLSLPWKLSRQYFAIRFRRFWRWYIFCTLFGATCDYAIGADKSKINVTCVHFLNCAGFVV